jgi:hypoxanthine phosphoribosyltransferase
MRVVNMDEPKMRQAMQQIAEELSQMQINPQVVLGVLSGGQRPAELLAEACGVADLHFITHRRKSSGILKTALVSLLRRFPRYVTNFTRSVESWMLQRLTQMKGNPQPQLKTHLVETLGWVSSYAFKHDYPLLLVDDAVDSGCTLRDIIVALESLGVPRSHIRVACITITQDHPVIEVEHSVFHKVLCRFPWSDDYIEAHGGYSHEQPS